MLKTETAPTIEFQRLSSKDDLPLLVEGDVIEVNGRKEMVHCNNVQSQELILIHKGVCSKSYFIAVDGIKVQYNRIEVLKDGLVRAEPSAVYTNTFSNDKNRRALAERRLL